jgi:hypothetical protein
MLYAIAACLVGGGTLLGAIARIMREWRKLRSSPASRKPSGRHRELELPDPRTLRHAKAGRHEVDP